MIQVDNKVLETRLLTRESVPRSEVGISTCGAKFAALVKDISEKKSCNDALDDFLREILQYEIEASKAENTNFDSDKSNYQELENEIESQIELNQKAITSLTQELSEQQQIRKHKIECEAMAKKVNVYPCKQILSAEIENVNNAIKVVQDNLNKTESRISTRLKQFEQLMEVLTTLENPLEDEESDHLLETIVAEEEEIIEDVDIEEVEHDRGRGRNDLDERSAKKARVEDEGEGEGDGEREGSTGEVPEEQETTLQHTENETENMVDTV